MNYKFGQAKQSILKLKCFICLNLEPLFDNYDNCAVVDIENCVCVDDGSFVVGTKSNQSWKPDLINHLH